MGSGEVIMPPKGYWERVQEICRKYDVLIVADEVINGFGGLGTQFGCDFYGIQPDMMICSKQLICGHST
jgi:4-aminobutyrate--pyruvate transaminase